MKKLIAVIALLFAATSFADVIDFKCQDNLGQKLNFQIDDSRNVINFSNVEAFGHGEWLTGKDLGATIVEGQVLATYNWDFEASFMLFLDDGLRDLKKVNEASFSYDDGDGISADYQSLKCRVQNLDR